MQDHPSTPVRGTAGIYLHVPWCAYRCPYCDFYFVVGRPAPSFADAVLREWQRRRHLLGGAPEITGVYFGGGTPSMLPIGQLSSILGRFSDDVDLTEGAEVTLEANPRDVTPDAVAAWRDAGVTRVSLGVQSFHDATLKALGRDHDGREARAAAELVVGARLALTVDLIFGAPVQGLAALDDDLRTAAALAPHVSVYCLTYEKGTHFARRAAQGRLRTLSDDEEAIRYERVQHVLGGLGFLQYEVSNHARPGHAAVHNRLYWSGRPYLGLGPGGASYLRSDDGTAVRTRNAPDLDAYLRGELVSVDDEVLDRDHALRDRMFAGLRDMERGIDLDELERDHATAVPAWAVRHLDAMVVRGAVERTGARCYRVTRAGALIGDHVAAGVLAP